MTNYFGAEIEDKVEELYLMKCEHALHRQNSPTGPGPLRAYIPLPQTMTQMRALNRWLHDLYRKAGEDHKWVQIYFRADELSSGTMLK
jgi:hypothetical protein